MSGGPNVTNRCKGRYAGCTADPPEGRSKCDSCNAEHNRRGAARREALKTAGKCVVCGAKAATVSGVTLTVCKVHREYYRARDEAARGR